MNTSRKESANAIWKCLRTRKVKGEEESGSREKELVVLMRGVIVVSIGLYEELEKCGDESNLTTK